MRLQRRTGERASPGPDARPELGEALSRPAEGRERRRWQNGVMKNDIVEKRSIAEQHVRELAGVMPRGLHVERDARLEKAGLDAANVTDLTHDFPENVLVLDGRNRHLDALLDGDRTRALLDGAAVGANMVDGLDGGFHERPSSVTGLIFQPHPRMTVPCGVKKELTRL